MISRSMVSRVCVLAVALLLVSSCTDAPLVSVDDAATGSEYSTVSKQAPRPVPFRAEMAWYAVPEFAPGFPAGLDFFDGRCSVPSSWVLSYPVTGDASHLGELGGFGSHCAVVIFNPDGSIGGTGSDWELTLVADNGDELTFVGAGNYQAGTTDFGAPWWSQDWTVTGGTGRFLEAGGSGSLHGVFLGFGEPSPVTMEGELIYDASNRSRK